MGRIRPVRFADDFLLLCQRRDDAERLMAAHVSCSFLAQVLKKELEDRIANIGSRGEAGAAWARGHRRNRQAMGCRERAEISVRGYALSRVGAEREPRPGAAGHSNSREIPAIPRNWLRSAKTRRRETQNITATLLPRRERWSVVATLRAQYYIYYEYNIGIKQLSITVDHGHSAGAHAPRDWVTGGAEMGVAGA